jgi:hypothetical protein
MDGFPGFAGQICRVAGEYKTESAYRMIFRTRESITGCLCFFLLDILMEKTYCVGS